MPLPFDTASLARRLNSEGLNEGRARLSRADEAPAPRTQVPASSNGIFDATVELSDSGAGRASPKSISLTRVDYR